MNIGDFNSDDLDFDDLDCGDWIVVIWIEMTWIVDFYCFFWNADDTDFADKRGFLNKFRIHSYCVKFIDNDWSRS